MKASPALFDLIRRSEGLKLQPYYDPAGVPTIGYGHKIVPPQMYDRGITLDTAEAMLAADVALAEKVITALVKVPLTQGQFDALVDFIFNLGGSRLAGSTLLKSLNAGKYDFAGNQLLLWDHVDGVEVDGLKGRRDAELAMWRQPDQVAA